jgi:hypothetical protein
MKIDTIISNELKMLTKFKVCYVGKLTELSGFGKLLDKSRYILIIQ